MENKKVVEILSGKSKTLVDGVSQPCRKYENRSFGRKPLGENAFTTDLFQVSVTEEQEGEFH
jgi:hypothetical protein